MTGFTIQTSLDGQNWSNTASQTMSSNGPVYSKIMGWNKWSGMLTGKCNKNMIKNKTSTNTKSNTNNK